MSRIWELETFENQGGYRERIGSWLSSPTVEDILLLGDPELTEAAAKSLIADEVFHVQHGGYRLDTYEINASSDPNVDKWLEFEAYVDVITYKPGWYVRDGVELGGPDGSRMWVQIGVTEEAEISFDPIAGKKVPWRGGKHYLSPHMCRQEVIGTVHHAIQRAELHEMNEWFRYRGRSIYNPHLDPDALVAVATHIKNFNTRENAMSMEDPS